MRRLALLTLLLVMTGAADAAAQTDTVPLVQRRVRVTATTMPEPITGTFVERSAGEIVLDVVGTGRLSVPQDVVTRLEVYMGQKRLGRRGALIGALGGVALFTVGAITIDRCDARCLSFGEYAVGFGILTGGAAALGYFIGNRFHTDDWRDVPPRR